MNTATVDKATWMRMGDGFYIALRVRDPAAGQEICKAMEDGKERELTIRKRRRSLDANAYAWTMMGQLAARLRIPTVEVYRQYIPELGDNAEVLLIKEDAVEPFREAWCAGHIGRMVEDMGPSKAHPGCHNVRFYYGSSDMDRDQMARLIDMIVADCKDQGIETLTDRERSLLVERWGT